MKKEYDQRATYLITVDDHTIGTITLPPQSGVEKESFIEHLAKGLGVSSVVLVPFGGE